MEDAAMLYALMMPPMAIILPALKHGQRHVKLTTTIKSLLPLPFL